MSREKTIRHVLAGVDGDQVTSITQVLKLIKSLSGDVESRDIESLVGAIGADVSLSTKVIRAAQPMRYNPDGVFIESIDQAVHMIGLQKISSISMALMTAQDMESDNVDPLVAEILSSSVVSACAARLFGQISGFQDNELCFVSGLFQNYGDLLLAKFMPDEYRKAGAISLEQKMPRPEAFKEVFGLNSGDLARQVFRKIKVPNSIWKSIKGLDMETVLESKDEMDEVTAAGTFSHFLTEVINSRGLQSDKFDRNMDRLIGRFSKCSSIDRESFDVMMKGLNEEIDNLNSTGGLPKFSKHIKERLKIIAAGADDPFPDAPRYDIPADLARQLQDQMRAAEQAAAEEPAVQPSRVARSKMLFHEGISKVVEQAVLKDSRLDSIISQICQTISHGFKARNIYFFAPSGNDGKFVNLMRFGQEAKASATTPSFSDKEKSFIADAVMQKSPVIVQKLSEVSREYSVSEWLLPQVDLSPHIAWPLVYKNSVIALVLMNGGEDYMQEEFKIGTKQMNQFFQFASLCFATRQLPSSLSPSFAR